MINTVIINELGYKIDRDDLLAAVEETIRSKGVKERTEIVISLVDEAEMKKLHKQYMETDETTDVLSFPLEFDRVYPDGITRLGDIAVCVPVAERHARENGRSIQEEINFLVRHGAMHLLGVHHE